MKKLLSILIFAALLMGSASNGHWRKQEPVVKCWPDGCCYNMVDGTVWSCVASTKKTVDRTKWSCRGQFKYLGSCQKWV